MNIWALPSLLAIIISLIVGMVVHQRDPKNLLNHLYLQFSVTIAAISFVQFNLLQAESAQVALFWKQCGTFWPVIVALQMHLVVTMVDPSKKHPGLAISLYISALVLSLIQLFPIENASIMIRHSWGWNGMTAKNDPENIVIAVWSALLSFIPIFIIARYLAKFKGKKRSQAIAFLIGLTMPTLYDLVLYVILPRMHISWPPLTSVVLCISTIFFGYAILRYELFTVNPVNAANNIVSLMPDLLILLNAEAKIVSVNKALVNLLQFDESELIGQTMLKLVGSTDSTLFRDLDKRVRSGSANDLQLIMKTKSGEEIPASVSASVLTDTHGDLAGYLCLGRDIRQIKKTEMELRKAKEQADVASKAKSEFLANMSHEIRTPMNAVIGFGDLLKNTELSKNQQEYVDTICQSGELLISLINDILDISKIESDKISLEVIDFNLEQLIGSVLKILRARIGEKPIDLNLRYLGDVPRIFRGDPTRIRQIFINLVNNAIKFTEAGDITVSVEVIKEAVSGSPNLRFSIKDTGIGIPKDKQTQIFEAFVQVDSSITRKYGGTGLGLSITKALIEIMVGTISVESELDKGSNFIFTLQLPLGKPDAEREIELVGLDTMNGKRVLIVDDNADSREIMSSYCMAIDMQIVFCAPSAPDCLQWLDAHPDGIDVILSDIMMPLMDGYSFARQVRMRPALAHCKLVALTSDAVPGMANVSLQAGFNAYLSKPFTREELYDILRAVFGDHRTEKKQIITRYLTKELSATNISVLVAEDNVINQRLMKLILDKLGCTVDTAFNGQEAVDKVRVKRYSVILMDVQMPLMGGVEASTNIRGDIKSTVPIIALTAHALKEDKDACLAAGMNDFLTKPVSAELLKEKIKYWSEQPPATQQNKA